MSSERQLLFWTLTAVAVLMLLAFVLNRQHRVTWKHSTAVLFGDPDEGSLVFQKKGCVHCHAVRGVGGRLAPDLGFAGAPSSSANEFVSAMWNHAPQMWVRMQAEKRPYPTLNRQEMADLLAYLHAAQQKGDPPTGQRVRPRPIWVGCDVRFPPPLLGSSLEGGR